MTGRSLRRIACLMLGLVATLAMTVACSSVAPDAPLSQVHTGDCQDLTTAPEYFSVSPGSPIVPCQDAHTVQIFRTQTLTADAHASTENRPAPQTLQRMSDQLCPVPAVREFLGAVPRDAVRGVSIRAYFPTAAQWRAGSRHAVCAVSVDAPAGGPATIVGSLADVMRLASSAPFRACYRQQRSGSQWTPHGQEISCDKPHSSQDVNAWLDVPTGELSVKEVARSCAPYVSEFLGHDVAKDKDHRATGVLTQRQNGAWTLQCAIGGDPHAPDTTGALLAHRPR